jgi:hypothetical protein
MILKALRVPIVFLCLLLTAGASVHAARIRVGAHGGLTIPDIRGAAGDPFTEGFASRLGPFFGVFAELGLASHFSLVAELNYASQGGKKDGLQIITPSLLPAGLPLPPGMKVYADFSNESLLDYVEIPLLARLSLGKQVRFHANAGPYLGFLVRARALTAGRSAFYLDKNGTMPVVIPPATTPLLVDMTADTDVKDSLKNANFGLCGGAGVSLPAGPGEIVIDIRFQLGLTVVQKDVEKTGEGRTGAFVVAAGYSLPL